MKRVSPCTCLYSSQCCTTVWNTANFYFLIGWCEPNRIEIKLYVIGQRVETTDLSYRRMKQYWLSLHINPLVTSAIHQNFITDYSIFWLNQNLEFSFWGYSQGKWTLKQNSNAFEKHEYGHLGGYYIKSTFYARLLNWNKIF